MIALCRYIVSGTVRSMRWVAPTLVFVLFEGIVESQAGSVLPTYAVSAAALFFISTWLTVVVSNSEGAIQEDITATTVGGRSKVRLAKLLTAYLGCLILDVAALIVPPLVTNAPTTFSQGLAGAVAMAVTALFGVALGALCSRPLVQRTAWAVMAGAVVGLVDVIIPNGPPIRQVIALLSEASPRHLTLLIFAIALETIVISMVMVWSSLRLANSRV